MYKVYIMNLFTKGNKTANNCNDSLSTDIIVMLQIITEMKTVFRPAS